MNTNGETRARYGMVIDLDRCTGCGACMMACAVEHNVPATPAEGGVSKGVTWMRVYRAENGGAQTDAREAFLPVPCQQCGKDTPCVSVCPQTAVEVDPATGIVAQIPVRCLGCRYCMAACPYHARYFNWWDPIWPEGMEATLNPDVAPRMRGVVEKCNFCHGRLHAARDLAAAEGRREIREDEYQPACAEACPTRAITFGDLDDLKTRAAKLSRYPRSFRLLEKLGTEPKIHYLTSRDWVRRLGDGAVERGGEVQDRG